MQRGEDQRMLVRAAVLYHRDGETQAAVADRLGVSRATVGRLLQRAREVGIIRIEIQSPLARQVQAEIDLECRYGLVEAVVIEPVDPQGHPGAELGQACAEMIQRRLRPNNILGLGWQSDPRDPISHLAEHLGTALRGVDKPGVTVAQLAGALPSKERRRRNPSREVAEVADALDAKEYLIPAPLFVDDAATAPGLLADSGIRTAVEAAAASDICLFGMGEVTQETPLYQNGYITDADLEELHGLGAVGDIAGRFFDAGGAPVRGTLAQRTIGVSLEDLAKAPIRIATAVGSSRAVPLRAAFVGGLANAVVTDAATAAALLADD